MSQIRTLSNNYPEKNAMHAQGMLLALIGMSTWYLHETYVSCMLYAVYNMHMTTMHVF